MANQYSAQNFSKQMKEIADKMGKRVEDVAEQSTKELFRTIIEETPVGDPSTWQSKPPPGYVPGKAKANWMPSVGAPDTTVTESRESSVSRLSQLDGNVAGKLVYLSNSVPYMYRLEYEGWSYQQSRLWIQRAVRSFESTLTKTISST